MIKNYPKIEGRKIFVALVGLGRISRKHIQAIAKLNNRSEIVAICDPVEELLKNAEKLIKEEQIKNNANINKITKFVNYSNLLKSIDNSQITIDLIVLTTPSGLHCHVPFPVVLCLSPAASYCPFPVSLPCCCPVSLPAALCFSPAAPCCS